jgi:pilus assembly protein TadC
MATLADKTTSDAVKEAIDIEELARLAVVAAEVAHKAAIVLLEAGGIEKTQRTLTATEDTYKSSQDSTSINKPRQTGVEDIHSLVSMLIQSERFGTSVAESLRVHAEGLRSKRKLQAQETAAKIPAKLSIPMILCIFPALFVVILGPSVLGIVRMLEPIISGR